MRYGSITRLVGVALGDFDEGRRGSLKHCRELGVRVTKETAVTEDGVVTDVNFVVCRQFGLSPRVGDCCKAFEAD
jgi:hypothetical protein